MAPHSILDDLGAEITAIISPVSICMLLVVLMVRGLTPNGSAIDGPAIGALVYHERSTDSNVQKFEGALLNAVVFIVAIAVVTFVLVGCFWLRCTRLIWIYMGFSGLTILAWLGGSVAVEIIQLWSLPIDAVTFGIVLYNFAVVGVLAVFFCRMPIFLTQSYLVLIGAVVAFWFTHLPEWTTWLLLVAMALYDLVAVLVPGGPLKLLVELAMERGEDIPALIYEARPSSLRGGGGGGSQSGGTGSPPTSPRQAARSARRQRRRGGRPRPLSGRGSAFRDDASFETSSQDSDETGALLPAKEVSLEARGAYGAGTSSGAERERRERREGEERRRREGGVAEGSQASEASGSRRDGATTGVEAQGQDLSTTRGTGVGIGGDRDGIGALGAKGPAENVGPSAVGGESGDGQRWGGGSDDESRPLVGGGGSALPVSGRRSRGERGERGELSDPRGSGGTTPLSFDMSDAVVQRGGGVMQDLEHVVEREFALPDAIKLGLGDFIFYSVLVGRAAMYDLMTVYACYLAIVAGLGATLALLAVYQKALPALPISVALGVTFYFLTRLVMDPFIVSLATRLIFL